MFTGREATSFNPHPASLPGDARWRDVLTSTVEVSIRTRHRCRVMRNQLQGFSSAFKFQSAPGIAAG